MKLVKNKGTDALGRISASVYLDDGRRVIESLQAPKSCVSCELQNAWLEGFAYALQFASELSWLREETP